MGKYRQKSVRWVDESGGEGPPTALVNDQVGVAWYDPGSFASLRGEGVDIAPGCASWEAWFVTYQQAFIGHRDCGVQATKVPVKAAALRAWLSERSLPNERANRVAFVQWQLEQWIDE